jgi:leucyl/phenylalanyl-tRNA---protein transferase
MSEFELTSDVLLQAYSTGMFPMADARDGEIFWCQPELRGVLDFEDLKVSRSLRKVLRSGRFSVTSDHAFGDVVRACAEREETWISHTIEAAYIVLHSGGKAHSVEVWEGDALVGGLYGVAIGGVFCGESMFHRATDASKVALVHLVNHLARRGFVLLDTQYINPHLATLGGKEITAEEYAARLSTAITLPATFGVLDERLVVDSLTADAQA